ncbi:hypothetical protein [Streptomyces sp. NPDC005799]|uniref:hypothetical protein n=1 Tax=Streptomyces sp. NPDC005799 TaxID=3154678 RepID=UPI003403C3F5
MKKIIRVQPHVQDRVLRDPFAPTTWFPNELIRRSGLSLGALGLLLELVSGDDWDIDTARAQELQRRAAGIDPEDIDELVVELEAAGYVTVEG